MVFNKIDLIDEDSLNKLKERYKGNEMVFVSVRDDIGLDSLKDVIVDNIK